DVEDLVDHGCIVDRRNEARADALDLVRREPATFEHLGLDRHHGNDLDLRVSLLQHLADAADSATGTYAGNDGVDFAAAVTPDRFRCSRSFPRRSCSIRA